MAKQADLANLERAIENDKADWAQAEAERALAEKAKAERATRGNETMPNFLAELVKLRQ